MITEHCHCGAHITARFRNGDLISITLQHRHRSSCLGRAEPLPLDAWQAGTITVPQERLARYQQAAGDVATASGDPQQPPLRRLKNHRRQHLRRRINQPAQPTVKRRPPTER